MDPGGLFREGMRGNGPQRSLYELNLRLTEPQRSLVRSDLWGNFVHHKRQVDDNVSTCLLGLNALY